MKVTVHGMKDLPREKHKEFYAKVRGIPNAKLVLRGSKLDIVLENDELALKILKEHCDIVL